MVPVVFQHIDDPQEAPEPSKAALVKLDDGGYFVLYYSEISNQLTLRIPESADAWRSWPRFSARFRFRARGLFGAAKMLACRATSQIQRYIADELSEFLIRHKDSMPEWIDFTMNANEVLLMPRSTKALTP